MSAEPVYVRLAPYAPRMGNKVQRFSHKGQLFIGGDRPTWYKVTAEIANELGEIRQEPHNQLTRPLFEIKGADEKEKIQAEEYRLHLAAMGVVTPTMPLPEDVKPAEELDITSRLVTGGPVTSQMAGASGRDAALAPTRGEDETSDTSEDASAVSDESPKAEESRNARSWRRNKQ